MSEYSHIANGPLLWAVTIVAVGIVLFQTLLSEKELHSRQENGYVE